MIFSVLFLNFKHDFNLFENNEPHVTWSTKRRIRFFTELNLDRSLLQISSSVTFALTKI
jgi:hypothetical protein